MNQEQILSLTRQSGMAFHLGMPHPAVMQQLTRFAELVEAYAQDECAKLIENGHFLHDQAPAKLFADQAAAAIRRMKCQ